MIAPWDLDTDFLFIMLRFRYRSSFHHVFVCTMLQEPLHEKVELMGGEFSRDFTMETTHLLAGAVGSQKYQVNSTVS